MKKLSPNQTPKNALPPLGAHFSIAKGFPTALTEAESIGATAMQIFAKSPMSGRLFEIPDAVAEEFMQHPYRREVATVVIHSSYLINLAKSLSPDGYELKSLTEDLRSAEKIGGAGAVLHFGKHLKEVPSVAEQQFVKNIEKALEQTKNLKASIILENTAGQGTELGYKLEEYGRIFRMFKGHTRIKACIDTAHLIGAGYNLGNPKEAEEAVALIQKEVGFERVACVHFNDSKKPAGSRVDRHQDIGHGTAGIEGLKTFAQGVHANNPSIALILETPQEHLSYQAQIELMKSWF